MKLDNSELAFTCNAKDLQASLSRVQGLNKSIDCLDTERRTFLLTVKDEAYLIGTTTDSYAMSRIGSADVEAPGFAQVDADVMNGLLKGRDLVKLSGSKAELTIQSSGSSRYKATMSIETDDNAISAERVQNTIKRKKNTDTLDSEVIEAIREGVRRAEIQSHYGDEVILAFITVTDKGVRITCADNFHITSYTKGVKAAKGMQLAIPARTFSLIDKFIGGTESVKFASNERSLRVEGDGFIVELPATQVEKGQYKIVPDYLKALSASKPILSMSVKSDIRKVTENIAVVTAEDNKLTLAVGTKVCKLTMRNRSSSVSETLKVQNLKGKERSVMIDPKIFAALINKVEGDVIDIDFFEGERGASGCFRICYSLAKSEKMTLVGTFYTE